MSVREVSNKIFLAGGGDVCTSKTATVSSDVAPIKLGCSPKPVTSDKGSITVVMLVLSAAKPGIDDPVSITAGSGNPSANGTIDDAPGSTGFTVTISGNPIVSIGTVGRIDVVGPLEPPTPPSGAVSYTHLTLPTNREV